MKFGQLKLSEQSREKLVRFLDKQGFYIILAVCLLAIGVVAIWANQRGDQQASAQLNNNVNEILQEDPTAIDGEEEVDGIGDVIEEASSVKRTFEVGESKRETTTGSSTPATSNAATSNSVSSGKKDQESIPTVAMLAPTSGELGMPYADSTLVYSKTLKQYMTHLGMDIACNDGDEVRASLSGTVERVEKHQLMGYTVELSHDNGITTVYASLQDTGLPQKGDKVERGQRIGYAGNTAASEIEEGVHIHFEVYQNGAPFDPTEFFAVEQSE